jgi:hypothetical protein
MFDVAEHLDELRSWSTDRLVAYHEHLVREQRRLHLEDLNVLVVLDERGRVDTTVGSDGESARTLRDRMEAARALESLPKIAAAAHAGALSNEQLLAVTKLADEETDAAWATRAPNVTPGDLARLARMREKPAIEESQARYAARSVRTWWEQDRGMLHVRAELPDVLGAKFGATVKQLTERMRPPKGQPWERWERRASDALGVMCDAIAAVERIESPHLAPRPLFAVDVPLEGPAEIVGIPLPDAMVEQLRASASVEPCSSTTAGSRRGSVDDRVRCHRNASAPCCCATGTAAARTATCATDCRCTTSGRAAGVAAMSCRTWPPSPACITRC